MERGHEVMSVSILVSLPLSLGRKPSVCCDLMLPLFHGSLPAPEQHQDTDVVRQLTRRFAHVVTLRQRQRSRTRDLHRRRNCASRRRQDARTRRRQVETEPEPDDVSLVASIRSLQAHIASLERSTLLRDSATLLWRANSSAVALDLTREYFRQLERGYDSADNGRSVTTARFMTSVFRPDIVCRDFQGLQAYMDQWEKYTTFHQGLTFTLQSLRLVDTQDDQRCAVTVYCSGELHVTFTQDTLKFLYPTLLHEREIGHTLVGSRGCLPIEMALHFDCQGRVFAFESRVNLVSTLLQLLQNPSTAIHALEASVMTADGHWQVAQDVEEAARRERLLPRQLL